MKKQILIIIAITIAELAYSQVTQTNNNRPSTAAFLGWNSSGTAGSLEIRNDFNQPINFSTNGALRGTINESGFGVGTNDIRNVMHLNRPTATGVFINFTNSNTPIPFVGSGGLRLGIDPNGNAQLLQHTTRNFEIGMGTSLQGVFEIQGSFADITLNGNVGLGNTSFFDAKSLLHLYEDVGEIYTQISNGYSGFGENDGFKIGLNGNNIGNISNAELRNLENGPMLFFTNNTEHARITSTGLVGLGTNNPLVRLDVNGEAAIRNVTLGANNLTRVLLVDPNNSGRVQYRDLSTLGFGNVSSCVATTNRLSRFTNANTICNSLVFDNGSRVGINTTAPIAEFQVETNTTDFVNTGIRSNTFGSSGYNFAGTFIADFSCAVQNTAVYGFAANDRECGTAYAGYFAGNLAYTGSLINLSDRKVKDNIVNINSALDILRKIEPKQYEYKTQQYAQLSMPKGNHYGFIAQEVEAILPNLVQKYIQPPVLDSLERVIFDSVSFKGVNYIEFIPLLVKGMNEQQAIIDSLNFVIQSKLNDLESKLLSCCGASQRRMANPNTEEEDNASNQQVELNNLQAIVLEQNVPNPFAEQTTISYNIPTDAQSALMVFYDMNGRKIKETNVEKGAGNISVFAPNLSKGIYSYSLIVDGKVIETKKMIKGN